MKKLGVKIGDNVVIIAGKDKGKTGTINATSVENNKVIVEGINIQNKNKKARKATEKSEIIKKEGPVDCSNVMVICPTCNKATRIGRKALDEKNIRVCKKCGASLDTDRKITKAVKKAKVVKEVADNEVAEKAISKSSKTTTKKTTSRTKVSTDTTATKKTVAPKANAKKVTRGDR